MKATKYSFIFVIIITLTSFGLMAYKISQIESATDVVDVTTAVLSLVVALWAFVISMMTYSSIDSVNVITKMEGNVLENENYITPFTHLIREYNKIDSDETSIAIFDHLNKEFTKNSKTAVQFANNLQYFIDLVVFFPYLFQSDRVRNVEKMDKLLKQIEKKKDAFLSISTGNMILIDETYKLIDSIIIYQKLKLTSSELVQSTILDVRGTMLRNSVTQTVYYNYLGLYYNQKAYSILRNKYGLKEVDFYSIHGLIEVKETVILLDDEDRELFILYLQQAKESYNKALKHENKDIMWEVFIRYNDARATYLLQLIHKDYEGEDWEVIMDKALVARYKLNILIKDILVKEEASFLKEAFNFEYYLASLVKMNILIAEQKDITDMFNTPKYYYNLNYDGILNDGLLKVPYNGDFPKVKDYQQGIKQYVNKVELPV